VEDAPAARSPRTSGGVDGRVGTRMGRRRGQGEGRCADAAAPKLTEGLGHASEGPDGCGLWSAPRGRPAGGHPATLAPAARRGRQRVETRCWRRSAAGRELRCGREKAVGIGGNRLGIFEFGLGISAEGGWTRVRIQNISLYPRYVWESSAKIFAT
jgi:hypothetical protein